MRHILGLLSPIVIAAFVLSPAASVLAHPHNDATQDSHSHNSGWVHENGIGPDPDNDTNPATNTGAIPLIGDAGDAADDPPYSVITFEPPPGGHGDKIVNAYKTKFGVAFGVGLTRQICEGQRHFQYNSLCTYEAAPSGRYAAGYRNYPERPLTVTFDEPVCVVTMAIFPTGGKEAEEYKLTIDAWGANDKKLPRVTTSFKWTNKTARWRNMVGAYYLDKRARKISISLKGKTKSDAMRFLIDDFAFAASGCQEALDDIADRTGVDPRSDDDAPGDTTDGAAAADG